MVIIGLIKKILFVIKDFFPFFSDLELAQQCFRRVDREYDFCYVRDLFLDSVRDSSVLSQLNNQLSTEAQGIEVPGNCFWII